MKTRQNKNKREKYTFAKHPYAGFVRRWYSPKDNGKPYNYIQKSHWHAVMQFLRTH